MSYNVNRNVTDVFYRYKMPKLLAKVEGKGNGIKTVIVNMVDIAKALGRPPTYPCKYFGCELGAQTQFDFKNDRYIVNGSHEASKLQVLLDGFIRKFVLCPECENPETILHPNEKKAIIRQTCKACGHQYIVDMTHRLTTFILKNPPDVKPDQQGTSLTKKKNRGKKEQNGLTPSKTSLHPESTKIEKSDTSDNDMNGDIEEDEDDWGEDDVSVTAQKERMKDLTAGVKSLAMAYDLESTSMSERLSLFFGFCKDMRNKGVLKPKADLATYKSIAAEADALEVKDGKAVMALVELLLDENVIKQLPEYRVLFILFTHGNSKSQKYLIGAVEKLIESKSNMLLAKVPNILKTLYDCDILDEETLLEWSKKPSKKYVSKETAAEIHSKAQPFLKWLKEAEEEESSENEDDEELEISYEDKVSRPSLKEHMAKIKSPVAAKIAAPVEKKDDDDSDIDIDNL